MLLTRKGKMADDDRRVCEVTQNGVRQRKEGLVHCKYVDIFKDEGELKINP